MNRVTFLAEVQKLNARYNSGDITRDEWTELTEVLLRDHEAYLVAEREADR